MKLNKVIKMDARGLIQQVADGTDPRESVAQAISNWASSAKG